MRPLHFDAVWVDGSNPRWIDLPDGNLPEDIGIPSAYAIRAAIDRAE